MLYVFLVDTGTMLHLDMNLALESVEKLKESIAKIYKIPIDKQVLLISGGENLDGNARVCSYSAGTDTNPIYLFTISSIESNFPPALTQDYGPESEMQEKVDGSLALPSSYQTVVSRAQLAQEFYEQAKHLYQDCERLVHEQHLQQQAWAAVIANLEDVIHSFQARIEHFEESFTSYMETREKGIQQLKKFSDDLKILDKIPILPALMEHSRRVDGTTSNYTLLEWINSKDLIYNLDEVAFFCSRALSLFDSPMYEALQKDIKSIYDKVNSLHMKEVKGLEDRLFRLDQLLHDGKAYLREQGDQAQAFLQNQNRAGNLGDPSILPDLCTSHCKQLQVMLKNHQHLRDLRRRCVLAKEELASNLHTRLKWVMYVERSVCEMDSKLMMYMENLKRLKSHLGIMQQAHNAPALYLEAVAEVVRRRYFTENFQKSAIVLAHRAMEVYENEMQVRKSFMLKIHNHFLYSLFSGLNDYPPPFATQPPPEFDANLPRIDKNDIEKLRQILPNMESHLHFTMTVPFSFAPLSTTSGGSSPHGIADPVSTLLSGEVLDTFIQLQRPGSGDNINAQSTPAEVLRHYTRKSLGVRTFSAFGKLSSMSSKNLGIMQVEEEEEEEEDDKRVKEPESETEVEEFERVEEVSDTVDHEFAKANSALSARNKGSTTGDDDDGISEAKQRKLEKTPFPSSCREYENATATTKAVHDRSVATEDFCLEELTSTIAASEDILKQKVRLQSLEKRLRELYTIECEKTQQLRSDLSVLRLKAESQRDEMMKNIKIISTDFETLSLRISQKLEAEQEATFQSVIQSLEDDHKKIVSDLNDQIKIASEKLQESHCQIDNYKQQLSSTNEQLEQMKQKLTSEVQELRATLEGERAEELKKLTLEHELELDGIKEELKALAECKEAEIRDLNETKLELEHEVQLLKRELELAEEKLREEFQLEKKQTLEALDAAYLERERDVVKKVRLETEARLEDKTLRLKQEYEDKLKHAYNECQATVMQYGENIKLEAIQEQHWVWEEEKQKAIDALTIGAEEKRKKMEEQHMMEIALLQEKALREKEEAIRAVRAELLAAAKEQEAALQAKAAECWEQKLALHKNELEAMYQKLASEKEQLFQEKEKQLYQKAEADLAALQAESEARAFQWEEQKKNEIKQLKEQMSQQHRSEVEGLRSRFRLCVSTTSIAPALTAISSISAPVTPVGLSPMEETPPEFKDDFTKLSLEGDYIPITKHEAILHEEKQGAHEQAWAEATEQLSRKHQDEVKILMESMKREHEEQLSAMRASILGEKQACFNEAVNRVIREKDKIIEQLRNRERHLVAQLEQENAELERLCKANASSLMLKDKSSSMEEEIEEMIDGSPQKKHWAPDHDIEPDMIKSDFTLSTSAIPEAAGGLTTSVAVVRGQDRILELEYNLRSKEEKLQELQNKLMELSVTSSTTNLMNQDKVSVLSCNVGDIILLCYDERHENYLAFLICPIYHFLHTDCLEVLGLKPAPGESRKPWVVAEVTDKEYCQTKKAQNRYRVPLGTKFYRIKAKPWENDPTLAREHEGGPTPPSPPPRGAEQAESSEHGSREHQRHRRLSRTASDATDQRHVTSPDKQPQ